jgi:hypothetical protein
VEESSRCGTLPFAARWAALTNNPKQAPELIQEVERDATFD